MSFKIRLATSADVRRLSELRLAVLENVLRFRNSVTLDHYLWFVTNSEVWVADVNGHIAGFSAADPRDDDFRAVHRRTVPRPRMGSCSVGSGLRHVDPMWAYGREATTMPDSC